MKNVTETIIALIILVFIMLIPSMITIVVLNYFLEVFQSEQYIPFNIKSMLAVTFLLVLFKSSNK